MTTMIVTLEKGLGDEDRKSVAKKLREIEGVLKTSFNKSTRFYDGNDETKAIWITFNSSEKKEQVAMKEKVRKVPGVKDAWVTY